MTTSELFSEAGKLYAENMVLVEKMREAYKSDVMACLKSIEDGVQQAISDRDLEVTASGKSRFWRLKNDSASTVPQFWTMPLSGDFVNPQRLVVVCGIPKADPNMIATLSALVSNNGAIPYEKPRNWYLYRFELRLDIDDPVENAVAVLAANLLAVEQEFLKASAESQ